MPDVRDKPMGLEDAFMPGLTQYTPYPGRIYSMKWRGRYPHLMPLDRAIWERFLDKYQDDFLAVQYDIMLGEGAPAPDNFSESDKRILYYATVKRADCLLILRDKLILVEVKPRLGMAALGQCLAYYLLWRQQYPYSPPVESMWVGEQDEHDMAFCMDALNFRRVVV